MIDPFTLAQTHPSLETRYTVQTHTMLEKTAACLLLLARLDWAGFFWRVRFKLTIMMRRQRPEG